MVGPQAGSQPTHDGRSLGGLFVAFEGGDGAGKSTQVRLLVEWLRSRGHETLQTFEPGDSPIGPTVRELLLHSADGSVSDRAEALLYAADRADHVASMIRPALQRGAVVVTDRYTDSSIAYQAVGRGLPADEVEWISRWATEWLVPDLTVVLDVPATVGLERFKAPADRLEREATDFHERVRRAFLELAAGAPQRYLVVDGTESIERVAVQIQERVAALLATPVADPARRS